MWTWSQNWQWTTSMAAISFGQTHGSAALLVCRFCSPSPLYVLYSHNSRTPPRIYMLMMVCWLTKLLHEITKYEKRMKKKTHWKQPLVRLQRGIMWNYAMLYACIFPTFFFLGKDAEKKGATRHAVRISFHHTAQWLNIQCVTAHLIIFLFKLWNAFYSWKKREKFILKTIPN